MTDSKLRLYVIKPINESSGSRKTIMAIKHFRDTFDTYLKEAKYIIEGKPFIINESQYQQMSDAELDSKLQECGYTINLLDVKNEREYKDYDHSYPRYASRNIKNV